MRLIAILLGITLVAAVPLLPGIPPYWITILDRIGLAALVAIGLVLLTGVGGMTSFGQAAFAGFGAYTTAVLTMQHGFSAWLTLPFALVVAAAAAVPLGLVTVRLSGHFLPLGTIAWGISLYYLFGQLELLGRYTGLAPVPPFHLGSKPLYDDRAIYYVIWACVLLAALLSRNLLDSRVGRAIRALRGGALAAESFGVRTARAKLTVFVFAALLAATSGWLYAHMQRNVNPGPFGLNMGIEYLLMAVVGGAGHIWGAIFGAGLIVLLKDGLQRILPAIFGGTGNYEVIVFGALLVAILQLAPTGLWPAITRLLSVRDRRQPSAAATVVASDPETPTGSVSSAPAQLAVADRTRPELGPPLLDVRSIRKTFGGLVAVNDVSFTVRRAEIVGLIGPNGAGKSTTFNLITGVLGPSGGDVLYAGERLPVRSPQTAARLGIARTFQHANILPGMTVLENAALGAHLRGHAGVTAALLRLDRTEERKLLAIAAEQIERVGLGRFRDRPAGVLSLGQVRLLEIARALSLNPALLLLDEPAAGLRQSEKRALSGLLSKLRGEGMTILLVEHDMGFVMGLTDHIVVLDFGTKIAEGRPSEIRVHPAVIEAYLGGVAA